MFKFLHVDGQNYLIGKNLVLYLSFSLERTLKLHLEASTKHLNPAKRINFRRCFS